MPISASVTDMPDVELQQLKRKQLAIAVYESCKDPGDPPYEALSEWEQDEYIRYAREMQRRLDPTVFAVMAEIGAQAIAKVQGWSWPRLDNCLPGTVDPDPELNAKRIQLHRIETRQKLRFLARQMLYEAMRHAREDGIDGQPHLEEQVVRDIKAQRDQDASDRTQLLKELRGGKDRDLHPSFAGAVLPFPSRGEQ